MYLRATTTYGSLIPGSEYIRSLVRQGTISPAAAAGGLAPGFSPFSRSWTTAALPNKQLLNI